jgi:hypothetical protein
MDFETNDFAEKGYQIFRGIVPRERIEAVKGLLEESLERALEMMKPLGIRTDTQHVGADIRALLAAPETDKIERDLRVTMTGHFPLDVRLDKTLWEIPRDEDVQAVIKSALGSNSLRMHMPPTARFILPSNSEAGVPAHQDVSYNRHMSDCLTMWVPLVEIDEFCGGVTVFEGSDATELPTGLNSYGIWNEGVSTEGFDVTNCVPMVPGDVLIFNKLLIHQSMPNVSDRTRFSVDYRFFRESDTSSKHYLDMQSWQVVAPALS